MAFSNAAVEIQRGNVRSRIVGPAPVQALDRTLNPHAPTRSASNGGPATALVFDPTRGTFLSGAYPSVKRALRAAGVRFRVRDVRRARARRGRWALQGVKLRPYQREVVATALQRGHGLLDIGTGGGKTILAAGLIAEIGLPTLVLVTTRTLFDQTVTAMERLLGVQVGQIGQGVCRPGRLTVALVQSLGGDDELLERFHGGCLVFDEGHHAAAASYADLIQRIDPRFHFYLSAVPFRAGADQVVLDALAGERLTGGRYAASFLIENGYACPVKVRVETCAMRGEMTERTFATLYREFIVNNPQRNGTIARIALDSAAEGKAVLVLVDQVRHGMALMDLIGDAGRFVQGATPKGELREVTGRFAGGELGVLVATAGMFQEGVSIDGIHVLIQAGGLRSAAKVIQSVGRGMRRAPGKRRCVYVDFFDDDTAGIFRGHSWDRLATLREQGFELPAVPTPEEVGPTAAPVMHAWSHVPGTRWFLRFDGDGNVRGEGRCLFRRAVPDGICKQCDGPEVCRDGGVIEWQDDRA